MKVYIGKYPNWIGPYQIADLLEYFCVQERHRDKFAEWLSNTWVHKFCLWLEGKRKRAQYIQIDNSDIWNMDSTLALIILPMLKKLQIQKHGAPFVDDEDVPVEIRSTSAPPKKEEYDTDEFHFIRWDWVMEELIWTFEQFNNDWEHQYYSGDIDFSFVPCEDNPKLSEMVKGPNDTFKIDRVGKDNHQKRIDNGLRLFGKYYQGLWD